MISDLIEIYKKYLKRSNVYIIKNKKRVKEDEKTIIIITFLFGCTSTELIKPAKASDLTEVERFLEAGSYINSIDNNSAAALMCADKYDYTEIEELLKNTGTVR